MTTPANELSCGCRLGPTFEYCAEAERLRGDKARLYRRVVSGPGDAQARRELRAVDIALDAHWNVSRGRFTTPAEPEPVAADTDNITEPWSDR